MRRRIVFPASEIRAVLIECKECGLQLVPGPGRRLEIETCPACGERWGESGENHIAPTVNDALRAIAQLRKANVEIFVEIEETPAAAK
jgi:hypothetical protein